MRRLTPVLAAALLLPACFVGDPNPIERDPGEAGVDVRVAGCTYDPGLGIVTVTYELTSQEEYKSLLVDGSATDETGTVVATGSSSIVGVNPGQVYQGQIILSPDGDPQGDVTCGAELNLAQEPIDL